MDCDGHHNWNTEKSVQHSESRQRETEYVGAIGQMARQVERSQIDHGRRASLTYFQVGVRRLVKYHEKVDGQQRCLKENCRYCPGTNPSCFREYNWVDQSSLGEYSNSLHDSFKRLR